VQLESLGEDVAGVLLVGAEGCSEAGDVAWLRDATEAETDVLKARLQRMHEQDTSQGAFDFSRYKVDGNGRPYWVKTVLITPETPEVAIEKARKYSRVVRVHVAY